MSSPALTTSPAGGKSIVPVRPPNKHEHDSLLESIADKLSSLENRRKFLQDRLRELREDQNQCRAAKETIMEERTRVEDKLASVNKEVSARTENVQKQRSSIPYLSEERVNEQIKKLEDLVTKHKYKRTEENKIYQEINRLKKSKRLLVDYNKAKLELELLRKHQRQIRERRDILFRERGELKKSEDKAKKDGIEIRDELDKIKVEIDELHCLRRQAVQDFRKQESAFNTYLYEKRVEKRQKRREEKEAAQAEKQRELAEIKATEEPYQKEIMLVTNLIAYCSRFEVAPASISSSSSPSPSPSSNDGSSGSANPSYVINNGFLAVPGEGKSHQLRRGSHESGLKPGRSGSLTPNSTGSSVYGTPMEATPVTTPSVDVVTEITFNVYKKDDNDDVSLFAGVAKKAGKKSNRMERRNSKVKPLTHNPEIYAQFDQLGLQPPCLTTDVATVKKSLTEKQEHFRALASEAKASRANPWTPAPPQALPEFSIPIEVDDAGANDVITIEDEASNAIAEKEKTVEENGEHMEDSFPCLPLPMISNLEEAFSVCRKEKPIVDQAAHINKSMRQKGIHLQELDVAVQDL